MGTFLRILVLFQLIRRRYFSDDLPASNPWSIPPVHRSVQRLDENFSDEEKPYNTKRYLPNILICFQYLFAFTILKLWIFIFLGSPVLAAICTSTTCFLLFQRSAISRHLQLCILSSQFRCLRIIASQDFP